MRHFIVIMLLLASVTCWGARPKWEGVEVPRMYLEQIDNDSFDLTISEGSIYLVTRKPVTVKVFTILGQLITSDTLGAGAHKLKMPGKGIYIVKIGNSTRRVTI